MKKQLTFLFVFLLSCSFVFADTSTIKTRLYFDESSGQAGGLPATYTGWTNGGTNSWVVGNVSQCPAGFGGPGPVCYYLQAGTGFLNNTIKRNTSGYTNISFYFNHQGGTNSYGATNYVYVSIYNQTSWISFINITSGADGIFRINETFDSTGSLSNNALLWYKIGGLWTGGTRKQFIDNISIYGYAFVNSIILTNATNSSTSVNISWTTDIVANRSINYGLTSALGTKVWNVSYGIDGALILTGLVPGAFYYYNITSCSGLNDYCYTNGTYNFTTFNTCRYLTGDGNWLMNCSQQCIIDINKTINGNLTTYDSGNITLNASLDFTLPNSYIFMNQTRKANNVCNLEFRTNGRIEKI
jgi:hypothetical protein